MAHCKDTEDESWLDTFDWAELERKALEKRESRTAAAASSPISSAVEHGLAKGYDSYRQHGEGKRSSDKGHKQCFESSQTSHESLLKEDSSQSTLSETGLQDERHYNHDFINRDGSNAKLDFQNACVVHPFSKRVQGSRRKGEREIGPRGRTSSPIPFSLEVLSGSSGQSATYQIDDTLHRTSNETFQGITNLVESKQYTSGASKSAASSGAKLHDGTVVSRVEDDSFQTATKLPHCEHEQQKEPCRSITCCNSISFRSDDLERYKGVDISNRVDPKCGVAPPYNGEPNRTGLSRQDALPKRIQVTNPKEKTNTNQVDKNTTNINPDKKAGTAQLDPGTSKSFYKPVENSSMGIHNNLPHQSAVSNFTSMLEEHKPHAFYPNRTSPTKKRLEQVRDSLFNWLALNQSQENKENNSPQTNSHAYDNGVIKSTQHMTAHVEGPSYYGPGVPNDRGSAVNTNPPAPAQRILGLPAVSSKPGLLASKAVMSGGGDGGQGKIDPKTIHLPSRAPPWGCSLSQLHNLESFRQESSTPRNTSLNKTAKPNFKAVALSSLVSDTCVEGDAFELFCTSCLSCIDDKTSRNYEELKQLLLMGRRHLKPFQKAGILRMLNGPKRALLYDEMGLGKTLQSLFCLAVTCLRDACWPALIVCPAALRLNWIEEIERWLPFFDIEDIAVVKNGRSSLSENARIIVVSYRMLEDVSKELLRRKVHFMIADEVHKTRSFDSIQARTLALVSRNVSRSILATGTPMLVRPFELYTQLAIVLSEKDKNHLMARWGWRACMRSSDEAYLQESHLAQIFAKPMRHLRDITFFMRTREAAWMQPCTVAFMNGASNPSARLYWDELTTNNQRAEILRVLHEFLSDLQTMIYSAFADSGGASKKQVRAVVSKLSQIVNNCSTHDRVGRMTNPAPFSEMLALLQSFNRFWYTIRSAFQDNDFLQAIVHMWDAHCFGIMYCSGQRQPQRHQQWTRRMWRYPSANANTMANLRALMEPYVTRRRKQHVLHDLPAKHRQLVYVSSSFSSLKHVVPDNTEKKNRGVNAAMEEREQGDAHMPRSQQFRESLAACSLARHGRQEQITWELQCLGIAKAPFVADYALELLQELDPSDRILIFGRHIKVLNCIQSRLLIARGNDPSHQRFQQYHSEVLSGCVPVIERDRIIRSFQTDEKNGPRVLLLSIEAMGVGVTLTRASIVLMAELHWSPQLLLQAEDRAHRIGCRDSVSVQYILAEKTLDENLWPMLAARLSVIESTLKDNETGHQSKSKRSRKGRAINPALRRKVFAVESRRGRSVAVAKLVEDRRKELEAHKEGTIQLTTNQKSASSPERMKKKYCSQARDMSQESSSSDTVSLNDEKVILGFRISCTGRVHLYWGTPSAGSEPPKFVPAGSNLSVADLRLVGEAWLKQVDGQLNHTRTELKLLIQRLPIVMRDPSSPVFLQAQAFVEEWHSLSITLQNSLQSLERPLMVPLSEELRHRSATARRNADQDIISFDRDSSPTFQLHRAALRTLGPDRYGVGIVSFKKHCVHNQQGFTTEQRALPQAFEITSGSPLCLYCGCIYQANHRFEPIISSVGSCREDALEKAAAEDMYDRYDRDGEDSDSDAQDTVNDDALSQVNSNTLTSEGKRRSSQCVTLDDSVQALFCGGNAPCYRSWQMKCYRSQARIQLSEMDAGICRKCKVDTKSMFYRARVHPPGSKEREQALFCNSDDLLCRHKVARHQSSNAEARIHWSNLQRQLLGKTVEEKLLTQPLSEGLFWEADHILAVRLGGGSASLSNFQTLCKPCHLAKTQNDCSAIRKLKREQAKHMQRATEIMREQFTFLGNARTHTGLICEWCGFKCGSVENRIMHDIICPLKPDSTLAN